MFKFICGLAIVAFLFWIGFKVTGALLKACIWVFIRLPIAVLVWAVGVICCCTLLLIPVGLKLFRLAWNVLGL